VTEPFGLEPDERNAFFADVSTVARTVREQTYPRQVTRSQEATHVVGDSAIRPPGPPVPADRTARGEEVPPACLIAPLGHGPDRRISHAAAPLSGAGKMAG
jgi:hypothetical protein